MNHGRYAKLGPAVEVVAPIGEKAHVRLSSLEKLKKIVGDLRFSYMSADDSVKAKLALLVEKYLDAFAEHDSDVGRSELVDQLIDVQNHRPVRQHTPAPQTSVRRAQRGTE